jgi:hypothetical protein
VILKSNEMFFLSIITEQVLQMQTINTRFINNIIMKILIGMIVITVVIGNQEKNSILSEKEL